MIPTYKYNVTYENEKFKLDKPRGTKFEPGLYGYQWIVIEQNKNRHILSGISETILSRLSKYISEFNHLPKENLKPLHTYVRNPKNKVSVNIYGPYDSKISSKDAEKALIASVPPQERLNCTRGGNGGGAWSQYNNLPPSQGTFADIETPIKYYNLKKVRNHITAELTPSVKNISCIYKIKKKIASDDDKENNESYIGMTGNLRKRVNAHTSDAARNKRTKVAQAIAKNPDAFMVGAFHSTINSSPRTLRSAEKHNIDQKTPSLNTNRGGGGPTKMKTVLNF